MSNAIDCSRESNLSRRICHLRAVSLNPVADIFYSRTVNTIMNTIRLRKYNDGTSKLNTFRLCEIIMLIQKIQVKNEKKCSFLFYKVGMIKSNQAMVGSLSQHSESNHEIPESEMSSFLIPRHFENVSKISKM